MEYDIKTILISTIGGGIGFIIILLFPQQLPKKISSEVSSIIKCLIFVMVITILNSLFVGNWDLKYMIDFLTLKKVGPWALRAATSVCYVGILLEFACYWIIKIGINNR
jgi:hypothetical protein